MEELQRLKAVVERAETNHGPTDRPIRDIHRRLGGARIERLVAEYQAGKPTTELAADYGIAKSTVLRLLENAGTAMRRQPISEEATAKAVVLYQEGKSLSAVARELGGAKQSIRLALLKAGVKMRAGGGQRSHETHAATPGASFGESPGQRIS